MRILDSIRTRFGRSEKQLTLKNPQLEFIVDALVGHTRDSIEGREYSAHIWVYRAANIWASASSCPMKAYRVDRRGEEVDEVELPFILRNPNPTQSMCDIVEQSLIYMALDGRSMWLLDEGDYGGSGEPNTIHLPRPNALTLDRGDMDYLGRVAQWRLTTDGNRRRTIDPQAVVYTRLPNPSKPGGWQSPIDALRETIDADYSARRHNKFLMKQHGRVPGVINYEDDLDAEELKRRSSLFHELFGNPEAAGKWLHVVKTKVQQLAMSPKDMDWLEGMKVFREEVASAYNIPPVMAGILDKATYSNFEQADKALVESCFIPLLRKFESSINRQILDRAGMSDIRVTFDVENHYQSLQESEGQRIEKYTKLVSSGVSPERAAEIAGLDIGDASPAHKTIWMSNSMVPVGGDLAMVSETIDAPDAPVVGTSAPVQDQALNGAQVSSLLEILDKISAGTLTPEGAVGVIMVAFPTVDETEARKIVAGAIKASMPDQAKQILEPIRKAETGDRVESLRSAVWRAQIQRRASYEKRAQKVAKKFLFDQRAAALAAVDVIISEAKSGAKAWKNRAIPSADEIADTLLDQGWDADLVDRMAPIMAAAGTAAAKRLLEDLGRASDEFTQSAIDELIRQQAALLPRVNESTRSALSESAQTLIDSVAEGTPIDEAAQALRENVRKTFGGSEARATLIARTEIGRAMEGARYVQMKQSGAATKVWISSRDTEVRDLHKSIDGEEVPVDEPFSNGLKYPLDPAGSAAQTVNCRCVVEVGRFT